MAAQPICSRKTPLVFKVRKQAPEIIPPSEPTPHEFKKLSDIDDQGSIKFYVPIFLIYPNKGEHASKSTHGRQDPVRVIKEALAKALVPYYPLAGRLKETAGGKLVVECNGEGIMFVEAYADVSFEDFGEELHPPFPCFEELLYDAPSVLDTPLILIQVTNLKCGGFIFALRFNHAMVDAAGFVQFMNAVAELAHGAQSPSIQPVWERHLLSARDPPRITCEHHEYDDVTTINIPLDNIVQKSFFFGSSEIAALKRFISPHLKCTKFEIITACLWRCRTIALQHDPEDIVRVPFATNARTRMDPPLPTGYYGNAVALPVALSTAGKLLKNPIDYAVGLVKKAKDVVTQEYMMSVADLMVLKGRPCLEAITSFLVSDHTRFGYTELDYGFGLPTFGGPATSGLAGMIGVSFYIAHTNGKGDQGIVVPICLPENAMEVFVKELNDLLSDAPKRTPLTKSGSYFFNSSS